LADNDINQTAGKHQQLFGIAC